MSLAVVCILIIKLHILKVMSFKMRTHHTNVCRGGEQQISCNGIIRIPNKCKCIAWFTVTKN